MDLTPEEVMGRARTHVSQWDRPRFAAQGAAGRAFLAMGQEALKEGIAIKPFSSFRDFKTQLRIWNQRWRGDKPLFDRDGVLLDLRSMSDDQKIEAIMGWYGLPGASRHHWGTEIDVVDAAAVPEGYSISLTLDETQAGGIFEKLHNWLDAHMSDFGFFRPYGRFLGGMNPEPWHLSYAPLSDPVPKMLSPELLGAVLSAVPIEGRERILTRLPELFERYIQQIYRPWENNHAKQ